MSVEPVPVAVIGAGNMGANHIRVYEELPDSELVEVVEPKAEIADKIQEQYDVKVVEDVSEISEASAASIAVPNTLHREVTEQCIEDGLDVLVEKPIALSVEDAEEIAGLAIDRDAVLMVGHIERFNPAVRTLRRILEGQELIAFEAHRLGPFNEHLSEVSVIFDLMIHDVDIIDSFVDTEIDRINAIGVRARSDELDHVVAQFQFDNGIIGSTIASHVTHGKIRSLNVTTNSAFIELDYQKQDIRVQRRGTEETTSLLNQSGYRTETVTESPYVQRREPLKVELEHFLECVRKGSEPEVGGRQGVRAVRFAREIVDKVSDNS